MSKSNCTMSDKIDMFHVNVSELQLITCIGITMAYVPCLRVIATNRELRMHPCYRFMFQLGLCDMIGTTVQMIFALAVRTQLICHMPLELNVALASIGSGIGWFSVTSFATTIAVNRLLQFVADEWTQMFFTNKVVTTVIVLNWLYGGCIWVVLTGLAGQHYTKSVGAIYYNLEKPITKFVVRTNIIQNAVLFSICILSYGALLIALKLKQGKSEHKWCHPESGKSSGIIVMHQGNSETQNKDVLSLSAKRELKVSLVAGIICASLTFTFIYWHFAPTLLSNWPYTYTLGNWFWTANASVNPICYLLLNDTIRKEVRRKKPGRNAVGKSVYGSNSTLGKESSQSNKFYGIHTHNEESSSTMPCIRSMISPQSNGRKNFAGGELKSQKGLTKENIKLKDLHVRKFLTPSWNKSGVYVPKVSRKDDGCNHSS